MADKNNNEKNTEKVEDYDDSIIQDEPEQGENTQDENGDNEDAQPSDEEEKKPAVQKQEPKPKKHAPAKKHPAASKKHTNVEARKAAAKPKKEKHRPAKKHAEKEDSGKSANKTNTWLLAILGIAILANIILLFLIFSPGNGPATADGSQAAEKAKVQVIALNADDCTECAGSDEIVQLVKAGNFEVTGERTVVLSSTEGAGLAEKYGIQKLPAVIVQGNVRDSAIEGFEKVDDALVFRNTVPPYYDITSKEVKGLVSVTQISASGCNSCQDLSQTVVQLQNSGVGISSTKTVASTSEEGMALIEKYAVTLLPTLVFSSDIGLYEDISSAWSLIGTVESDGSYVIRNPQAIGIPYYDLAQDRIAGLVDVWYIEDETCEICYNVSMHRSILIRFGLKFSSEKTLDIKDPEAALLIEKYNITKVPTVIMSPDASAYQGLLQAWEPVGSVEEDGMLVFRKPEVMQGSLFKDLQSGQILGQAPQGQVSLT